MLVHYFQIILNFMYVCQSVCLLTSSPKLDKGISPDLDENSTQKYWASVGQPLKPLVLLFFIIENLNWTFYWSTKMFILNKENYVGNQNTRHPLRKLQKLWLFPGALV